MPPRASRKGLFQSIDLPWAKPKPQASPANCQRAWKVLRKAHSSSAQKPKGREPTGVEHTSPVSSRQEASRRWI